MNKSSLNNDMTENVNFFQLLKRLINLKADTDEVGSIELIKSNINFQSANAWTLVFAIFIASVGLNVNSTAVVIGAMLISPLMGPIVGVGLALGTYDFILLKKSLKNLAAAVVISLVASTVYFLLSPLSEVQSELLARTRPSFFDVLIAFFGGAAGIVAISRKEKGNAIPGVAIATALMPPLCTAGFGLATRNYSYFFGAMYLFIINCVFISISTFIFVRYLGFKTVTLVDSEKQKNINRWIAYVGAAVIIPSFFMAWYLQQESFFNSQANKYISQELRSDKMFVVDREISYNFKNPKIKITLLGNAIDDQTLNVLKQSAKKYSISPDAIEIRQSTLSENLEKKIGEKISAAEDISGQLQVQLKKRESELDSFKDLITLSGKVSGEISAIFPKKTANVLILKNRQSNLNYGSDSNDKDMIEQLMVVLQWRSTPSKSDIKKAIEFLSKRVSVREDQVNNVVELRP